MSFWKWSRTASSNASADGSINWAEGQPPSSVNDSARAMMAAAAKYRDDIAGAIATGGTSTAYTVTSYQTFDTLAHLDGNIIAFVPHTTNGATVTLAVDGLTAKPLRSAPSIELQTGALIQGTPYLALYNNSDGAFYLHGASNYNSYSIPLGGMLPYIGSTAPNSAFALPYGQAISRTTYATLFSLVSTTFGTGDGSTTFNLPDLRGRVIAGLDNMGGSSASRLSNSFTSTSMGSAGGEATHTLTQNELASHGHTGSTSTESANHQHSFGITVVTESVGGTGGTGVLSATAGGASSTANTGSQNALHVHTFISDPQGGGAAHNNAQPTMVTNIILRII